MSFLRWLQWRDLEPNELRRSQRGFLLPFLAAFLLTILGLCCIIKEGRPLGKTGWVCTRNLNAVGTQSDKKEGFYEQNVIQHSDCF